MSDPDQRPLPFEDSGDPAFEQWEQTTREQREERAAPLERLKQQVRQRELDDARAQELDTVVELDDGSLHFLSELGPAEEARVVAFRRDLSGPWDEDEDPGEDQDEDDCAPL